jgi:hypothetical protein
MAAVAQKYIVPIPSLDSGPYTGNVVLSSQRTFTFDDLASSSSTPAQIPYRPYERPHSILSYPRNLYDIIFARDNAADTQLSPHFIAKILAIIDATPDLRSPQQKMDFLFEEKGIPIYCNIGRLKLTETLYRRAP